MPAAQTYGVTSTCQAGGSSAAEATDVQAATITPIKRAELLIRCTPACRLMAHWTSSVTLWIVPENRLLAPAW